MKMIGKVISYNDKFGIIQTENEMVDFEKCDISFEQQLKIGDIVIFRMEERFPNIKLARNITLAEYESTDPNEDDFK